MTEQRNEAPIRGDFEHGYTRYSKGCRCDVCRAAKAQYMAARRAAAKARREADSTYIAYTPSHGTRYAYEELGCQCPACLIAQVRCRRLRPPWSGAA